MLQEKRRFTRVPFKVKTEMRVGNIRYAAEGIENLSIGGCLLPIRATLDPGTSCRIRILLSGTSSDLKIKINGEITRCDRDAIAVKFTHIDPDGLFYLQGIVRYNSSDPEAVEEEITKYPTPR